MKLKKLLPLAGITGVAAIAAPLVTSCAQKGTCIIWDSEDETVPKNNPKNFTGVEPFESEDAALKAYLDEVNTNKTIGAKDILYSVHSAFAVSTHILKHLSVRVDSADSSKGRLSFKVEGTFKDANATNTVTTDFVVEMKNVDYAYDGTVNGLLPYITTLNPYTISEEDEPTEPRSAKFMEELNKLANDKTWSIHLYKALSNGFVIDQVVNYKNIVGYYLEGSILEYFEASLCGVMFASEYYSNAEVA